MRSKGPRGDGGDSEPDGDTGSAPMSALVTLSRRTIRSWRCEAPIARRMPSSRRLSNVGLRTSDLSHSGPGYGTATRRT